VITAEKELTTLLDGEGIAYERLPHRHTETADDEARALGLDPHEVAKTVVLSSEHGHVRAVIPSCNRVDANKVRRLLNMQGRLELSPEADLASTYPGFDVGAVPPVGGPAGDRVAVDRQVADRTSVVIEAGTHDASLRLGTTDLLVLAHAAIGDICRG
jgi:Ala-tRNA(Pro) deacylase